MMKSSLGVFLLFIFLFVHHAQADDEEAKTYIIHWDHSLKPDSNQSNEEWHRSELSSLSNPVRDSEFLYSYSNVMHGFSARLTQSQLREIESSLSHVATHEESFGKLLTTHSPKFLGLNHDSGLWPAASRGEGVIIGLLDTGAWPESTSFSDHGMPQVPARWRGKCQNDTALPFRCNNKLIGMQVFTKGQQARGGYNPHLDSPRDYIFHGTHTSSTAAGNYVEGASQNGFASGTAKGVAPRSHIAMYKAGNLDQAGSDVLASMDQAVSDGVDVISLSIGWDAMPYFEDAIAIASLGAVERGVSVVCAAGNMGKPNSTRNGAPWLTTVGAGTLDRYTFAAEMSLPDGSVIQGISKFPISAYLSSASIYYGFEDLNKSVCEFGSLNPKEVAAKVVLCGYKSREMFSLEQQVQELQRKKPIAGIIVADPSLLDPPDTDNSVPIMFLPFPSGARVTKYASRVHNATVKSMRFVLSTLGTRVAPLVADYSSRGPDPINPGILKPDVIAPGSNILAAVAPFPYGTMIGKYNLVSDYFAGTGTSMAAPHVAGVVALLKAYRPEWSPATIRSAMMTTAYILDNNGSVITDQSTGLAATPLDYGAGHIDPNRAMNPGLVYDLAFEDYVNFICSLRYNEKQMRALLRRSHWNCSQPSVDINYPSFVAVFRNDSSSKRRQRFTRVLTNVDDNGGSTYRAVVVNSAGLTISVEPDTLTFSLKDQKHRFALTLLIEGDVPPVVHGRLSWIDQHNHIVSSPVVALCL